MMNRVEVVKSDQEESVPTVWRKPLAEVVSSFVRKDFALENEIAGVNRISQTDASSIEESIDGYGAELVELPEEAWDTSVCRWTGNSWDILVDLFTTEESHSDLVMFARVVEGEGKYLIEIDSVHVP